MELPDDEGEGVGAEPVEDEVLEVLAQEVVVADLAAFGEGVVVVFEAVDGAVVGYADEEGAPVPGVGETGDGLDCSVLGRLRTSAA